MRSDINSIECKNCGNEFSGKFCNHCGQTAATNKVDATFIYEDLKRTFIQFNSGFFFTLKKMFLNPGGFMEQYLQGKRIHYTKPFAFLIITCGLNVLLYHYLHVDIVLNGIEGIDAKQIQKSYTSFDQKIKPKQPHTQAKSAAESAHNGRI